MNFDRTCCVCKRKRPISRGCKNDYSRYGGRKGTGRFICADCAAQPITSPKTLKITPELREQYEAEVIENMHRS